MTPRTTADSGLAAVVAVLASAIVVAIVATGLVALDVPERLACSMSASISRVTAASSSDSPAECPHREVTTASDPSAPGDTSTSGSGTLTATTFSSNDSVASPAIRDTQDAAQTVRLPPEYARCAPAPDDPARTGHPGTAICLAGSDTSPDGDVFTGSDLILRCATSPDPTAAPTTATVCGSTDTDPWATLRTGPSDQGVRFCQPVRVERTDARAEKSPFRVDWACASWAGNLHHCTNVLSSDVITTARSNDLVNYTETTTWVTDPTFRQTWPTTCGSRTFGTDLLACTPTTASNTAPCDLRGFQGLPLRPATCVYFHPTAGEDPTRSNTLDKPMHCRLATTPDDPTDEVSAPVRQTARVGCPQGTAVSGPRRRLTTAPEICDLVEALHLPEAPVVVGGGPVVDGQPAPGSTVTSDQVAVADDDAAQVADYTPELQQVLQALDHLHVIGQQVSPGNPTGPYDPVHAVWVTPHLPEGTHVIAGEPVHVVHPEHAQDLGVLAAVILGAIGPPPPPPGHPWAFGPIRQAVQGQRAQVVVDLARPAGTVPGSSSSAFRLPSGTPLRNAGPHASRATNVAAMSGILSRFRTRLQGARLPGHGTIDTLEDQALAMEGFTRGLVGAPRPERVFQYLVAAAQHAGLPPELVVQAFYDSDNVDFVPPDCRPSHAIRSPAR